MRGRALVALVVAVAVVALSACGDDDSSNNDAAASPATTKDSGTTAPTGEPIRVMSISAQGTQLTNHPEVPAAVRAAATAINDAGGLRGRPVEVIVCNEKGNAQGAAACAQEAVAKKVVAVIGASTPNGDAINPILEAAGIANIGNNASAASDLSSPISFPLNSGGINAYQGAAFAMAKMGLVKLGVVSLDIPSAATILGALKPAFDAAKTPDGKSVEMVSSIKVPLTASDFAPYAAALKDQGAQGVVALTQAQAMIGLMKADAAIGHDVVLGVHATNLTAADTKAIGGLGGTMIGTHPLLPPTDEAAGPTRFRKEMKAAEAAGVDDADDLSYGAYYAWTAMQAFKVVAKTVTGDLTASTLLAALKAAKNLDVDGLLPQPWTPVDASRPKAISQVSQTAVYISKVQPDGTWKLLFDDPIDVAALRNG
jgi:branched-chain amino acid transport system substrate-binding protein